MAPSGDVDTVRILVATDNHVGYNERDPIRGDDSWRSFHEIMCIAKERDVDMVLLAGDLFHENKPSRKSMYQVMRSLRMNCFGEKPCELEMLSDASENFQGAFNHVNYEDPDINVAIPVFSIHGNHDDPSGEGHLAALDLLQMSGLVNYYGRTPESDNIVIKPVLFQKGHTKLALYGMSNVRDERLFRTFRDGNVKFYQPSVQKDDWFNLISVHQNHHAYTETGYLPETFLPEFMNLVIWGHEHECVIQPRLNPEMGFYVMQPGSSVATSLAPGEAVTKHVAILSITGKQFKSEAVRLKSIRPFVMKEIILSDERALKNVWKQDNNRVTITRHLIGIVDDLIKEARTEWLAAQDNAEEEESAEPPLPLIRLRVEYTSPEGGKFDCENPQRFSNRFVGKVANVNDVIQFYRKKASATRRTRTALELPDESVLAQLTIDAVKVEKLVREFLTAQSLTILPQNSFGDAVGRFVDKDDKHAMEVFVNESLSSQVKNLLEKDELQEHDIATAMEQYRTYLESNFVAGQNKNRKKRKLRPKPDNWDSEMDGNWSDAPGAVIDDGEPEDIEDDIDASNRQASGRKANSSRTKTGKAVPPPKSTAKKGPPKKAPPNAKRLIIEEDDEEDSQGSEDVIMIDDEDSDSEEDLFVKPSKQRKAKLSTKPTGQRQLPSKKTEPSRSTRQTTLYFSQQSVQQPTRGSRNRRLPEPSEDEISDDEDAFEPISRKTRTRGRA